MTAETLKTISHEALDSIKATNVRLRFYDGSTAKPKGDITIEVEVQHGHPVKLEFVIIDGPSDRYHCYRLTRAKTETSNSLGLVSV